MAAELLAARACADVVPGAVETARGAVLVGVADTKRASTTPATRLAQIQPLVLERTRLLTSIRGTHTNMPTEVPVTRVSARSLLVSTARLSEDRPPLLHRHRNITEHSLDKTLTLSEMNFHSAIPLQHTRTPVSSPPLTHPRLSRCKTRSHWSSRFTTTCLVGMPRCFLLADRRRNMSTSCKGLLTKYVACLRNSVCMKVRSWVVSARHLKMPWGYPQHLACLVPRDGHFSLAGGGQRRQHLRSREARGM
jgi:hypothetical protein